MISMLHEGDSSGNSSGRFDGYKQGDIDKKICGCLIPRHRSASL